MHNPPHLGEILRELFPEGMSLVTLPPKTYPLLSD